MHSSISGVEAADRLAIRELTYCLAHHVSASEGKRTLFVASLRYYDLFAKVDGKWLFAERKLIVDWTDTRQMGA